MPTTKTLPPAIAGAIDALMSFAKFARMRGQKDAAERFERRAAWLAEVGSEVAR